MRSTHYKGLRRKKCGGLLLYKSASYTEVFRLPTLTHATSNTWHGVGRDAQTGFLTAFMKHFVIDVAFLLLAITKINYYDK